MGAGQTFFFLLRGGGALGGKSNYAKPGRLSHSPPPLRGRSVATNSPYINEPLNSERDSEGGGAKKPSARFLCRRVQRINGRIERLP